MRAEQGKERRLEETTGFNGKEYYFCKYSENHKR